MSAPIQRDQDRDCSRGTHWYTCSASGYVGCCVIDPCSPNFPNGCPENSRGFPPKSASASNAASQPTAAPSRTVETLVSNSAGQTVYVTITHEVSPAATSNSTEPAPQQENKSSPSNGTPVGAIAGGTIGGVAVLASVMFLLFFLRRKKQTKERRRATLPPPYADGDMSEQLSGTTAIATDEPERKITATCDIESPPVPQLDGAMVVPPSEVVGDDLNAIAELPTTSTPNPPSTPVAAAMDEAGEQRRKSKEKNVDADNHVMSWSQYNSMGTRQPAARLSQPHGAPDTTSSVWENMSPTSPTKPEKNGSEDT
ncbi:hypothetical protein BS50DRAFT_229547 [Corynespora cassiicola Philippines]|uniref:Uncharacterized protein n=1 Tax=Corynespora cassiicola Philippines TaxID=1448308 RepID=A0A2T2N3E5_CORCC|nr:hypothetical protein BS50DRAFT_229547 [Corynespora cassiicola Philippines]